jgi:flagellar operon protein
MNTVSNVNNQVTTSAAAGAARMPSAATKQTGVSFADVFKEKVNDLKFSAHAQTRMKSRNIDVSPSMMVKLTNAVDSAQKKGSKNSLVLFPDAAFIVNITNRTVVTAMDGENIRENIFTNIDSTVLAG